MLTKVFFSCEHLKLREALKNFNREKWKWGGRLVAKALCIKAWKAGVWNLRTPWLPSECGGDRVPRASWTAKLAEGHSLGYVKSCHSSERSGDPWRKAPPQPWASTHAHTGIRTHVCTQHEKKKRENFGKSSYIKNPPLLWTIDWRSFNIGSCSLVYRNEHLILQQKPHWPPIPSSSQQPWSHPTQEVNSSVPHLTFISIYL